MKRRAMPPLGPVGLWEKQDNPAGRNGRPEPLYELTHRDIPGDRDRSVRAWRN